MAVRGGCTGTSAMQYLPIAEWVARGAGRMIREAHAERSKGLGIESKGSAPGVEQASCCLPDPRSPSTLAHR